MPDNQVCKTLMILASKLANRFTSDDEEAKDLAGDAVLYVLEHESVFDPNRDAQFTTFAYKWMYLFMLSQTRTMKRWSRLVVRISDDAYDLGISDVATIAYNPADIAIMHDTVAYLRRILFPHLSPAAQRVFDAILVADSAHAEDLVAPARVGSTGSVDVHKSAIRKTAMSLNNSSLKILGFQCKQRTKAKTDAEGSNITDPSQGS